MSECECSDHDGPCRPCWDSAIQQDSILEKLNRLEELEKELADNDRWFREVLTDFHIPYDDHKQGRRSAIVFALQERARLLSKG